MIIFFFSEGNTAVEWYAGGQVEGGVPGRGQKC